MKRSYFEDTKLDRISNLPEHLIDKILCILPIRDAVTTSILSREWRYRWTKIPDIVFNYYEFVTRCFQGPSTNENKLIKIVDSVLLQHNAPIRKFTIEHENRYPASDTERWIVSLSNNPIEELVLRMDVKYELPSCFFRFENLIHLKLWNCLFKPPTTFRGFPKLKTLFLDFVTQSQDDDFENLIAKSPLLESLSVHNFYFFTHLKIEAPNLEFFSLRGAFEDICFVNTSRLTSIFIDRKKEVNSDKIMIPNGCRNLRNFFVNLSRVRSLVIRGLFLQHLVASQAVASLSKPCKDLLFLSISIDLNDLGETSVMFSLLKNSPNLEELRVCNLMSPFDEEDEGIKGITDCATFSFGKLRRVNLKNIYGEPNELEFIKFLLSNSPVLETMTIESPFLVLRDPKELSKTVFGFRRVSKQVEIILVDELRL